MSVNRRNRSAVVGNAVGENEPMAAGERGDGKRIPTMKNSHSSFFGAESTTATESADGLHDTEGFADGINPSRVAGFAGAMSPTVVYVNSLENGGGGSWNYSRGGSSEFSIKEFPTEAVMVPADLSTSVREFSDMTDPDVIVKICREHLSDWACIPDQDIIVSKILAGLTNQLFSVQVRDRKGVEPQRVLFRIYGKGVSQLYDSEFEVDVFTFLAGKGVAPQCLAVFSGGRIEEWIDGAPLPVEDARKERFLVAIGRLLGRFHKLHRDEDFPSHWPKDPACLTCVKRWAEKARNIVRKCTPDHPQYAALQSLGIDEMLNEVPLLQERLVPPFLPPNVATSIVFCHNDTQENNVMRVGGGNFLRLIDFEYSAFNYGGYDLANYFVECTIDYTYSSYPFFSIDESKYPSTARYMCIAAYLSEVLDRPVRVTDMDLIQPVADAIERCALASHLGWGFWSVIRAPQAPTFEDFDYIVYAKERFECYKRHLARLSKKEMLFEYTNSNGDVEMNAAATAAATAGLISKNQCYQKWQVAVEDGGTEDEDLAE